MLEQADGPASSSSGETSVSGGKANLPGVSGGAALFLALLLTMLNTFRASAGFASPRQGRSSSR
jgi:hypothetical protein